MSIHKSKRILHAGAVRRPSSGAGAGRGVATTGVCCSQLFEPADTTPWRRPIINPACVRLTRGAYRIIEPIFKSIDQCLGNLLCWAKGAAY